MWFLALSLRGSSDTKAGCSRNRHAIPQSFLCISSSYKKTPPLAILDDAKCSLELICLCWSTPPTRLPYLVPWRFRCLIPVPLSTGNDLDVSNSYSFVCVVKILESQYHPPYGRSNQNGHSDDPLPSQQSYRSCGMNGLYPSLEGTDSVWYSIAIQ